MTSDHNSYFIYILSSKSRRLYLGVTNDLEARVWQHKSRTTRGHATRYNIDRLVYFEEFDNINQAIDREKQVKKVALIEQSNPTWRDLSVEWLDGAPIQPRAENSLERFLRPTPWVPRSK